MVDDVTLITDADEIALSVILGIAGGSVICLVNGAEGNVLVVVVVEVRVVVVVIVGAVVALAALLMAMEALAVLSLVAAVALTVLLLVALVALVKASGGTSVGMLAIDSERNSCTVANSFSVSSNLSS